MNESLKRNSGWSLVRHCRSNPVLMRWKENKVWQTIFTTPLSCRRQPPTGVEKNFCQPSGKP